MEILTKSLLDMVPGQKARILKFTGGVKSQEKLTQYGIFPDDRVEVLRSAPFEGPILLCVNGREIALGRGIASRVVVDINP